MAKMVLEYIIFFFFKKFLLLFNYSCMPFLPIPPHLPPPSLPSPLILPMCPFFFFQIYLKNFFFKFIYCYLITVVCLFPPPFTPPQVNPLPSPLSTLPLGFVHVSFIVVPVIPSSHCPHPTPPRLLLDCS